GLLCELPSVSGQKKGLPAIGNAETAFMFIQRRGTPPRLHYRVDLVKYLKFLSQPIDSTQTSEKSTFESDDKDHLKVPKEGFESDSKDPLKEREKDIQKPQNDPHVYNEENYNDHHNDHHNKTTTTTNPLTPPVVTAEADQAGGGGDDIDSLIEAALWQQEKILPPRS
ncbi:MAG: hypothetical protein JNL15_15940, partial [Acinetobacter johnsonii]|nr:hypothetical protein [Acinetobacter johnsonii]